LPEWSPRRLNFYYWYYGTYAMFQIGESKWRTWNEAMKKALLPTQRRGGCEDGSWDGLGEWCVAGGRVYATALNALTLEIYYRYEREGVASSRRSPAPSVALAAKRGSGGK
jgi:hypothetical protein